MERGEKLQSISDDTLYKELSLLIEKSFS
jgi:hypothetical protein